MGEPETPDNADLQVDETQDASGTDVDAASDVPGKTGQDAEQTTDGAQETQDGSWPKSVQGAFTRLTQSNADLQKTVQQLVEAQAGNVTPEKPTAKPDAGEQAASQRLSELLQKSPELRELNETVSQIVASRPEAFVQPEEILPDILAEITPALREIVLANGIRNPKTINLIAKELAVPKLTALVKADREAKTKARDAKRAAMAKTRPVDSSGEADDGTLDVNAESVERVDSILAALEGEAGG